MHRKTLIIGLLAAVLATAAGAAYLMLKTDKVLSPSIETEEKADVPEPQPEPAEEEKPELVDVQPVIDAWGEKQTGEYSIVVYDLENEEIVGSHQPNKTYFAASIYKLYVAYEGYLQIDKGEVNPSELFLNGQTRAQCLDAMIRSSDSPCAEKLWNELGKTATTEKLKTYGINDTSMTNITTTAQDAATILSRLYKQEDLSSESVQAYLDSMKTQDALYRRGLPSGMSDGIVVYNKVGWNELKEWHDTAIVSLPNERNYVISLFTESVGTANIRELAASLESALSQ